MAKYFEIVSGKPAGEVYHREVFVAFTKHEAEECAANILNEYEPWELENWLWGPHIFERDLPPTSLVWDGNKEVAAPIYHSA